MTAFRDPVIVLASLAGITLLAWLDLLGMTEDMNGMSDMRGMDMTSMPMMPATESFGVVAAMWAMMMVGMLLPAAAPMILLYTTVQRKQGRNPVLMTGLFSAGYLARLGRLCDHRGRITDFASPSRIALPSLALVSTRLAGVAFLLAAAYEFSPIKNHCLEKCRGRSPSSFSIGVLAHIRTPSAGGLTSIQVSNG